MHKGAEFFLTPVFLLASAAPFASTGQLTGHARTALAIVEDLRTRRPIVDLGADDFVIQEDGQSREILSVRVADYPVVLMVDTTGPDEDMPVVRKAARRFIEQLGAERAVAFGTFGESPKLLAGFDAERADLMKQVDEIGATTPKRSVIRNSPFGAAAFAAKALAPMRPLFSAMVLLSPAQDMVPATDVHEGSEETAAIVASGVMVHIIAITPATSSGDAATRGTDAAALRGLAEQTRGQFVTIYTAASYQAALDQIAARMASELMIEYIVPNASKATDVKVGVRLPGARVRGLGVK